MRAFSCDHCQASIAFENTLCGSCGSPVAYDRRQRTMVVETHDPLEPLGLRYVAEDGHVSVPCAHLDLANCNWLADVGAVDGLCSSCQLTRTRPANDDPVGLLAFGAAETAKRRLLFQLDALGLPSTPRTGGSAGIAFDLLSSSQGDVEAGYRDGVITLDLGAAREEPSSSLAPLALAPVDHAPSAYSSGAYASASSTPFASPTAFATVNDDAPLTWLARLRREIGAWYFDTEIDGTDWFDRLLQLTPDERAADAFAEACALYLGLRDALETAASFDVQVGGQDLAALAAYPASPSDFDEVMSRWRPLSAAVNALSRSRGEGDPYPAPLADSTLARLRFVHDRFSVR